MTALVESIGWLLATLAECAASLLVLSAACRQAAPALCAAGATAPRTPRA